MASFTDNAGALSHFDPYVQQIPVDAYLNVGLQKQAAYNQGVEKTQEDIDSIANLPVIKSEQKDYVQQRMGQLQNSVSKVVGADFSNSQLTNQIGGLTSQIARDPVIQSAVQSTMRYQGEAAKMQEAQKQGKSDPANEWDFQNDFQKWMNDGQLKSSFNGEYTPFVDVKGKILKAINDGLKPNEQIQDLPFKMQNGVVLKDKKGVPMIDDVMVQKMTKTLSPERIQEAIQGNLTEGDLNQLNINGRYEYRGVGPEGLKQMADNSYNDRIQQIDGTLAGYKVQKLSNTSDLTYQDDLDRKINDLQLHRQSLVNQYPQDVQFLQQNPEAYKGELYKQNYISNMTNGYAYSTNSLTYKDSPYFKAYMDREKNAREAATFSAEYGPGGFKQQELDLRKQEVQDKLIESMMRRSGKLDANGQPLPPPLGLPVEQPLTPGEVGPTPTMDTFAKTTADMKYALEGAKLNVAASLFNKPGDANNPVTVDANGVISYKDAGSKALVETGLAQLRERWIADHSSVSTAAADYFQRYDDTNNRIANRDAAIAEITRKANSTPGAVTPEELYKNISGIVVNSKGAGISNTPVSPSQLADFQRKLNGVFVGQGAGQGHVSLSDDKANAIFGSPVEKAIYQTYKKYYNGDDLTPAQQAIIDKLNQVNAATRSGQGGLDIRNEAINRAVPGLVQSEIPASFPITGKNNKQSNDILNALVNRYQKQGAGDLPGGSTIGNISKIAKNEKDASFSLEALGNNQFGFRISNVGSGIPAQTIPLTEDDLNTYFPSANIKQFSAVKEALALTKNGDVSTTDVRGKGDQTAFVLQNNNLNQFAVKYHVEDPHRDGKYQIKVYVLDRAQKVQPNQMPVYKAMDVPLGAYVNDQGLANFLSNFGDAEVQSLLSKQKK